jgi:hypothetical protein
MMFINRQAEIAFLSDESVVQPERSKLIIILGPSGVGKSALVSQCLEKERARKHFEVAVENHPRNKDEDRLFLTRLAGSMIQASKVDRAIPSLQEVLHKNYQTKALKSFCTSLAKHFGKKFVGEEAYGVLESVATAITTGAKDLPEMMTPELELYIQQVVLRIPSLIKLENAQLLDRRSHEFFLNLFSESRNLLGIFEVTTSSNVDTSALGRSFEERQVDVRFLSIGRLRLDDIIYELREKPEQVIQLMSRSYDASDGNLHPLQILTAYSDKGWAQGFGEVTYAGLTKRLIEAMPRSEQVLLAAVVVHAGFAREDIIRAFFASSDTLDQLGLVEFDLEVTLSILIAKYFLAKGGDAIRTRHDSIITTVSQIDRLEPTTAALGKAWRGFYQSINSRGGDFFLSKSEVLDWLTYFNARLQDTVQTLRCLEEIGRLSFNSVAPSRLLEYLTGIRGRLARLGGPQARTTLDHLLRQQAFLLYEAGWFDEALECLTSIIEPQVACQLLKAELLCAIGRADEGVRLAEELASDLQGDAWACANLIRLHGLRMLDDLDQCRKLFFRLLENDSLTRSELYPTLLRFADLALNKDSDQNSCIEFIEKSINVASQLGLEREEALARMALVQQLGYVGAFDKIESNLSAIEDVASRIWLQRYPLINNRAVLGLHQGAPSLDILRMLSQALVLCSEFLDRLIVKNNQLVAGCLGMRHETVIKSLDELISIVRERAEIELEIKKIVLFNVAKACIWLKRVDEGNQYLERARLINTQMDESYWRYVLYGGDQPEDESGRLKLGFYPIFISHWYLSSSAFERIL